MLIFHAKYVFKKNTAATGFFFHFALFALTLFGQVWNMLKWHVRILSWKMPKNKYSTFYSQLIAVNDKMAESMNMQGPPSHNAGMMHTLQRHRDILQVHTLIYIYIYTYLDGEQFYHSLQNDFPTAFFWSFRTTHTNTKKPKTTSSPCGRERISLDLFTER